MKACCFCGTEFPDERPYSHCTAQVCVDTWRIQRRSAMSVVLIPKVGETIQYTAQMKGVSGRSSGR